MSLAVFLEELAETQTELPPDWLAEPVTWWMTRTGKLLHCSKSCHRLRLQRLEELVQPPNLVRPDRICQSCGRGSDLATQALNRLCLITLLTRARQLQRPSRARATAWDRYVACHDLTILLACQLDEPHSELVLSIVEAAHARMVKASKKQLQFAVAVLPEVPVRFALASTAVLSRSAERVLSRNRTRFGMVTGNDYTWNTVVGLLRQSWQRSLRSPLSPEKRVLTAQEHVLRCPNIDLWVGAEQFRRITAEIVQTWNEELELRESQVAADAVAGLSELVMVRVPFTQWCVDPNNYELSYCENHAELATVLLTATFPNVVVDQPNNDEWFALAVPTTLGSVVAPEPLSTYHLGAWLPGDNAEMLRLVAALLEADGDSSSVLQAARQLAA